MYNLKNKRTWRTLFVIFLVAIPATLLFLDITFPYRTEIPVSFLAEDVHIEPMEELNEENPYENFYKVTWTLTNNGTEPLDAYNFGFQSTRDTYVSNYPGGPELGEITNYPLYEMPVVPSGTTVQMTNYLSVYPDDDAFPIVMLYDPYGRDLRAFTIEEP